MRDPELGETIKALRARIMGLERENRELKKQNKHYREALTFYAEESNYDYDVKVDSISYVGDQLEMKFYRLDSEILYDRGEKARKALEDEK